MDGHATNGDREVIDGREQRLVTGDGVVQQPCGGTAGTSVGAVSSPAPAPAFLQGDAKALSASSTARRSLVTTVTPLSTMRRKEGATCGVERLGREQGLDDEAGVQGERVGSSELLVLDPKTPREGGPAPAWDSSGPTGGGTCRA